MNSGKFTIKELKDKLKNLEAALDSIKRGEIDLIIGENEPLMVRLKSLVEENEKLVKEWQATFDSMPISIMILDTDLNIKRYNKATPDYLNISEPEITGKKCCEIIHKTQQPFNDCPAKRAELTGKREQSEVKIGDKYYLITVDPVYDESEKIKSFIHTVADITEKKKAESQMMLLKQAVENSGVSIIITDTSGIIQYVNPGFTKITGYTSEEAIGQNPRLLKSGKQTREFYRDLWDTILSGRKWEGEIVNKKKNGELYWEKSIISPIFEDDGNISFFVAIKEDITEKKKIIDELIEAREKAEESNRLKSAFLANISHEIRTPLNGILGFSELLQNAGLTGEEKDTYLRILRESGERMLNTINQIIEISKIEAGIIEISRESVNISNLLKHFYNFYKPQAEKKGLSFSLLLSTEGKEIIIESDKLKLESIISNLVNNAIKFTPAGFVELGVKTYNEEIEIYVKDSGIGIPSSKIDDIFQRFVQIDYSFSRPYEGMGLGLAITKSYAEILGGRIIVESEEGRGSIFRVILPPGRLSTQNIEKEPPLLKRTFFNGGGKVILVAEDDDMNYYYAETILTKNGYSVIRAKTGEEVIKKIKENDNISMILMDIKLPVMSGYEATRRIREFNNNIPIIAQTAYASDQDKEKAFACGCTDYLSKPFRKDELLAKINRYFNKGKS